MRLRMQVEDTLDRLQHGTGQGMPVPRAVSMISVELNREPNGLGENLETCKQLRDGLQELRTLKREQRDAKIQELRDLASKLPQFEL